MAQHKENWFGPGSISRSFSITLVALAVIAAPYVLTDYVERRDEVPQEETRQQGEPVSPTPTRQIEPPGLSFNPQSVPTPGPQTITYEPAQTPGLSPTPYSYDPPTFAPVPVPTLRPFNLDDVLVSSTNPTDGDVHDVLRDLEIDQLLREQREREWREDSEFLESTWPDSDNGHDLYEQFHGCTYFCDD